MPDPKTAKHLYWIAAVILLLGAAAWWFTNEHEAVPGIPPEMIEGFGLDEPADAEACLEAGGFWNECASACPDAGPEEVCIQVCVERCEGLGAELERPVYFANPLLSSPDFLECDEVHPVRRTLMRTGEAVPWPEAALRSLLSGPGGEEAEAGFLTEIPENVALRSLDIRNGVARADFSSEMNAVAGSCRVIAIRAQIERTLLQFPEIREVVISVEGNVEEALQP